VSIVVMMILAVGLDRLVGEPKYWHPLIGFGNWADKVEHIFNRQPVTPTISRFWGMIALILLIIPVICLTFLFQPGLWTDSLSILILWIAIGNRSLEEHANRVYQALVSHQIVEAQQQLARIVSRDTDSLDSEQIAGATVESVLENGCDAVFAALFWFWVAGVPGVIIYRLSNTLDAMWGYKTPRYLYFGWAAARLDDLLNYIPARLTALSYACLGQLTWALICWAKQGKNWKSPNAGVVMATGAGALGLQLGGVAVYHGQRQNRPILGQGRVPTAHDIKRAVSLLNRALILWLIVGLIIEGGGSFA